MVFFATILLAFFAVCNGYPEKLAFEPEAKQYEQMSTVFNQAAKLLLECNSEEKQFRILSDLGQDALVENGDWVLLHRERPLEVPHGG